MTIHYSDNFTSAAHERPLVDRRLLSLRLRHRKQLVNFVPCLDSLFLLLLCDAFDFSLRRENVLEPTVRLSLLEVLPIDRREEGVRFNLGRAVEPKSGHRVADHKLLDQVLRFRCEAFRQHQRPLLNILVQFVDVFAVVGRYTN